MVITHNLGFPRIGTHKQLKEALWQDNLSADEMCKLKQHHWQQQSDMGLIPIGGFSLCDQILDMSATLGHSPKDKAEQVIQAGEMAQWFNTNDRYIAPEFSSNTTFKLNEMHLVSQITEASAQLNISKIKPVIIGPVTYLKLGNIKSGNKLDLLERLLPVYKELLITLKQRGIEWVQIDEPILTTELDNDWKHAFDFSYHRLKGTGVNLLLATYFGKLQGNLQLACNLPVQGLHLDSINAYEEVKPIADWLPNHKVLSLGIIDGRNTLKTDLNAVLNWLKPLKRRLQNPLWLAPSCSLLYASNNEEKVDPDNSWIALAIQKLNELKILATALNENQRSVSV